MTFKKGDAKKGGREPGTPNKATAEIKEAAREHGPAAIKLLAGIMNNPKKPDALRMGAAQQLLDRGYGKPVQPLGTDPDEPIVVIVRKFAPEPDNGATS